MKKFEEWLIMSGQGIVGHYDYHEEELAKEVWRAALEWVMEGTEEEDATFGSILWDVKEELK